MANKNLSEDALAVRLFFKELNKATPDKSVLADMIERHPNLFSSKFFAAKLFPQHQKDKPLKNTLGRENISRMMKTATLVSELHQSGAISGQQFEQFKNLEDEKTHDNIMTRIAKNASLANAKLQKRNSGGKTFSENDKKIFNKLLNGYKNSLSKLSEMGFDLDAQNSKGFSANSILNHQIKFKNQNSTSSIQNTTSNVSTENAPLNVNISQEPLNVNIKNEDLNVGGKTKPLNVKVLPKEDSDNEDEKEATVEPSPEADKGKSGKFEFDKVKEKDIIDFMYNDVFLDLVNWTLEKSLSKAYNAVDNLCNDYERKSKSAPKKANNSATNGVENAQQRANDILNMPIEATVKFRSSLKGNESYLTKLNEDVLNNLGKNPQKWEVLNPKKPAHKKMIDNFNLAFKNDPQACLDKIKNISENSDNLKLVMLRVYKMAYEKATVEYVKDKLENDKDFDFAKLKDKDIKKELSANVQKNFQNIMLGIKATTQYAEDSAILQGITDKKAINADAQNSVEILLRTIEKQTDIVRNEVKKDIDKGNFAGNNKKPTSNANAEQNKLDLVFQHIEQFSSFIDIKKKDAGLQTLNESAEMFNSQDILTGKYQENVSRVLDNIQETKLNNDQRREAVKKYRESIKNDKNISNAESGVFKNNVIVQSYKNRKVSHR